MPTWTALGQKIPIAFFDPANKSTTTWSPQLNPKTISRTPGNVRKYVKTTNGTSVIIGDREYPPSEIKLEWDQIDYSDYVSLSKYTSIDPCVYVDNLNNGYLGVLVIDDSGQVAGKTSNVWSVKASFLVIAPYNGTTGSINQLSVPTLSDTITTSGGYIPASTTLYFFLTVWTAWGETLPSSGLSVTTSSANSYITVNWTQPSSTYFTKARLYWSTTNNAATATFLTEVQAGQTGSFPVYGSYFQYSPVVPPTYGTAFTGYWNGALWVQGT